MPVENELIYRTEDIDPREIRDYFVETEADRRLVDACKTKASVVLQGSRGVGKSFLLRVAEAEMGEEFSAKGVLPVYVIFNRAALLQTQDPDQFQHWMLAKICNRILRAARQRGLISNESTVLRNLISPHPQGSGAEAALGELELRYENSWREPSSTADGERLEPQLLTDALEDLCQSTGLSRVVLLVDEAAHVFIPEQQRQFFTLMRDLRSPYLSVKAAVYPGVTSFGDSFQMTHDATLLSVDRDILDPGYLSAMREIVEKQDSSLIESINRYGEAFDALAFAATGNPRILLKTLSSSRPFTATRAQQTIREYFRESIWSEHSSLGEKYEGHRELIDWGRDFVESNVLPQMVERNQRNIYSDQAIAVWIHRDAPEAVKESLRLLCYSGILREAGTGLRATRSGTGTRYIVNAGCLVAYEGADLIAHATRIRRQASIKRMVEFGARSPLYRTIEGFNLAILENSNGALLEPQLNRSVRELDLTPFLRRKLAELGFETYGQVLRANEGDFQAAYMVGEIRARKIMNAAVAAVLEYISG
jgi:hypothetical protein